jgi:NADH:ubiquinone reductase (H+-translocating)
VIGDTALVVDAAGNPLPGIAPAAKQAGQYVAGVIRARLRGRPTRPFRYRHLGNLATIGRTAAVADFGWLRLTGPVAWLLWGMVHIYFLIGFRNRLVVALDWLWAYLTFQRGARLITETQPAERGARQIMPGDYRIQSPIAFPPVRTSL